MSVFEMINVNHTTTPNHPPRDLPGLIFILVGPSGVGKNSLMPPLMAELPLLRRLPTATTRLPRPGEQEGRDHFFVSLARFGEMVRADELLEHQEVHPDKWYGTVRAFTEEQLASGAFLIADIDILGAQALKAAFPANVITIFIAPPDLQALDARLHERGNMPEQEIQERLRRAAFELAHAAECDHIVINDSLENAVRELTRIITTAISQHRITS